MGKSSASTPASPDPYASADAQLNLNKGTAQYNQRLSEQRAQAVMRFLVAEGVQASRLSASGKGFAELLNANDPLAAENRRVRIKTRE